ncbi:MAG: tetratricopeptide repeat protein [Chloroflexota bacterium]
MLVVSLGLLVAALYPLYAQDSGGTTPKIVGVDVYLRAVQEVKDQKFDLAVSDFSLVILLNPTFTDPYLQRAQSYIQLKNTDAALVDLNHLIKLNGGDPAAKSQAYMARAEIFRDQNDAPSALADYGAAIRLAPDDAQSYYERGQIYMAQTEYDKALKDMTQVASIAPTFSTTYYYLGVLNNQAKEYADAVKNFNTYIKASPSNYQAYAGRADAYIQQEQYALALPDLNQAIKLESRSALLYLQRGLVQQKLGDEQASATDYLEWIKANLSDQKTDLTIRPGESQVLPMGPGLVYILSFDGHAGQKVTISTATQSNEQIDSLLILADGKLNPLTADDDSGGNMNASIKGFVLPGDGSYSVVLSHAGGNPEGPVRVLLSVN